MPSPSHRDGSSVTATGERRHARQAVAAAWLIFTVAVLPAAAAAQPQVTVREDTGSYTVAATFSVPQSPSRVVAVLTDYDEIARFMPDVRTSRVLERGKDRTVVEQEAVARLMMFSKRIHLVLEVHEGAGTITFRDRCGKSFEHYDGSWTVTATDQGADIAYALTAKPSFDVPAFLLKRLLKRDATHMIERLQAEIAR